MSKKIVLLVLSVFVAFSLSGCGGSSKPISISITSSSMTVDGADTVTLTATVSNDKNAAGVSWAITSGGGSLSNTSTSSATYTAPAATSSQQTITITATSVAKTTQTGTVTITVAAKPTITTSANLTAAVGTASSITLQASGGISPYTWALTTGTLPTCLTLNASTGAITGTPLAACAGTYNLTFTVTDSGTPTKLTATANLTLTITAPTLAFPTSLSAGAVGTAYTGSVAATGSLGASTYTIASGGLPTDLTLSASTGAITGTPKASDAGTFTFTVKVVDAYGDTATSGNLSITITAPTLTFPTSLSGGAVGTAYSASVAATGVVGASTYTIASGSIGSDLSLNASTGAITGTPKAADAGTFTFTVKVVDAYGDTATSGSLSIAITAPTLTFPTSLSGGTVGTAYSASVAATGVVGASTYTIATGSIGSDLSLDSSTGAITGTPKASDVGTFTFTVKVVDAYGDTKTSGSLSIAIVAPTITFPTSLPGGTVGTAYSGSVAATGPAGATTYTIASGSLGSDLSLNSSTGAITGTPKAADVGTLTFTVKVVDAYGDTATSGSLTITVVAAGAIVFGAAPTATATYGVAYSSALSASGGAGALTYSISSGSLPAGLNLNTTTGAITGTPSAVGAVTFTAKAQDNFGDTPATQSYTITVNPGAATHFAIALTSSSTITAGGTVSFTVTALDAGGNTATGYSGTVAFTSTDTNATLPASASLTSGQGSFSATLKTAGSQTVTATDTANASITATSASITVNPGSATTLVVVAPATATTNVPFNFTVTAKDQYNNTATGFTDIVHFTSTDSSAVLPANSGLNGATGGTGTFSATLKTTGSQTITATDAFNASINGTSSTITVSATVIITTGSIGPYDSGQTVSTTLNASGGSGNSTNYTWSWVAASGSSIPTGLSLSAGGVISGTPTAAGTYNVSVTVKDTGVTPNQTFTQSYTITINGALSLPAPNPASLPNGYTGISYSGDVAASGGSGNYCYSVTGLPSDGLSAPLKNSLCGYVAPTFPVSGTPTAAATVSFTLTVTDGTGASVTKGYTITITNPTAPVLPTPSSSVPGSATNGQSYTASITATGGVGPTYTWTVNGSTTLGALGTSGLASQFSVSNSGSSTLAITGSPTSTGTVTFTAQVKDNTSGLTSSTQTYTIQVNSAGSNVSGQISPDNFNFCGGTSPAPPIFNVDLDDATTGSTVQVTSTGSNGGYQFTSVPNGSYVISPVAPTGAEAAFHPAFPGSNAATVNNADVTNRDINVTLGYTVSGTVSYSGPTAGQVYVELVNSCGGSGGNGTSLPYPFTSGGAFTIHGAGPGSYQLLSWMDPSTLNEGAPNEADPMSSSLAVSVNTSNVTGQSLTLTNPSLSAPTVSPNIKGISPADQGVIISYGSGSVTDNNGLEIFSSYTVQWSTSSTSGFSSSNQATFKATGSSANVWIVRTGNANVVGSLSNGTAYYFKVWGSNSAGSGPAVTSTSAVTPNPPATGSGLNTVSGTITIPSTVTIASGAPLYAGLYDQFTNTAYAAVIANPSNSVGNNFTVYVPSSPTGVSNYILFGILDQNKDGLIDTGDDTNVHENGQSGIAVTGNLTGQIATLPSANSIATVSTHFYQSTFSGGTGSGYSFNFQVRPGLKLPVAVTLSSHAGSPNVIHPLDFSSYCQGCGSLQYQGYFSIGSLTPPVGGTYTFTVTYSDGTQDTGVTATVTGWNGGSTIVGASDVVTGMLPSGTTGPATGTRTQPNFSWTVPSADSSDVFGFSLADSNYNTFWQIPGNNSNLNGFPSALTSISWGIDPTDSSNDLPSGSTLTTGSTYNWYVTAQDSNGNQATNWMYYVP
ncbi:MAG TPA: putative Ig domain-containing protein [Terracidiphilus sp.]|nr:putative Ig domain-containing protein [Terracidiphilus sp.]